AAGILARLGTGSHPSPHPLYPHPDPPPLAGEGIAAPCCPLPRKRGRVRVGAESGEAQGLVLWCLRRSDLYGPGLLMHGLDSARLVLVRAAQDDAILWAVEEGLRAGPAAGLAAVVGEIGQLPMVAGRRLQLAAERSGVTALILRRWRSATEATTERDQPSAALTRWRVSALPSAEIAGEPGVGPPCLR